MRRSVPYGSSTRCAVRSPSRPRSPSRTFPACSTRSGSCSARCRCCARARRRPAGGGGGGWRGLAGTVVGFVIGALLLIAIGTGQTALWVALPLAVLVAAYAPGTTPFLGGQAAFTVTIVGLFNLLAPACWRVGLLRIEDVSISC